MDKLDVLLEKILEAVEGKKLTVPLGISNRHIHLKQEDTEILFGKGYELNKLKDLSQKGQFAAKEVVTVCGPKSVIEKVRILGPARKETQVEVSISDCLKLGIKGKVKMSGDICETPGITLVGPKGTVVLSKGIIVSQRHIHMDEKDAKRFGVSNGEIVSIKIDGIRGGQYDNTCIRVDKNFTLECHLDTEEANALGVDSSSKVRIIKK
ncbi:phosphate propanoyltransferase [uncultured Cetobacterium sp.]|uniref:phosphate propanoyltransferase n=1 Tax=uncultured Cetobacterium sp. TaxID=527638 RepID=UPI00260269BE|nr:phosphate propanoyltransferase [uncultured Cetobacterium sp.]